MAYSNKEVFKIINAIGKNSDPKFKCINPDIKRSKWNSRYVEIQCIESKEKKACLWSDLRNDVNPFRMGSSRNFKIKKIVDLIGKKSNPKFICINPESRRNKKSHRYVLVQCLSTKQIKEVAYADIPYRKTNPFRPPFNKFNKEKVEKIVNHFGKKATPSFEFVPSKEYYFNKKRFVKIRCVNTGKKRIVNLRNIMRGHNTFSETNRELFEVHPLYEKLFKKLRVVFFRNFRLERKIIDFVFKINNVFYGLEVKRSDLYLSYNNVKKQIDMYKKIGKYKKYNLKTVLLTDPSGNLWKHGSMSIKELEKFIKDNS